MKRRVLSWQIGLFLSATGTALIAGPVAAETPVQTPEQAAASKADSQAKQTKPKTLEAIIVTAERREQNLQDVPSGVSVLDAAEINKRGLNNVTDLSAAAPGLLVAPSPAGGLQAQIGMRSTAQVNPALYFDTPVPIYVDGVYYGKTTGAVFDLVDVERIEVLRGPQGSLFGRNAYAGAVNFITHRPSGVFTGRGELSLGNYDSRLGKLALDLPAIDLSAFGTLKASVGGRVERRDGWVTTTPGSSVSELNSIHKQSGFVDLLLDATPNLSIEYRYDLHDVKQTPPFGQLIRSDLGIPGLDARSGRQTTGGVNGPINEAMRMDGHALHADWKLGDFGTLKYIYGYRRMTYTQGLDLDGTILPIAGTQYDPATYVAISNELQWLGQAGPFDWLVGLYDYRDHGLTNNPQTFFFGAQNFASQYGFSTGAKALYGQVDYKPTDRLTLTLGARRSVEHKTGYRFETMNGFSLIPPGTQAETSAGAVTPTASASYKLSPQVMVYGRYAEGFKGGGFNGEAVTVVDATTPFKPEKKRSFEVGAKSTLWGDKLRINGDVYFERNSDLQQSVFTAVGSASSTIVNVGKSHDQGLELEVEALLSRDLTLRLDYALMHTKYDKFMVLGQNVADNRAPVFAPRQTVALVADATFARTAIGNWHAMADYRFNSSFYQYAYQIQRVDPTAAIAADARLPASGTLNAKIELANMRWGPNIDGTVSFWVRNLANTERLTGSIPFGPGFGNLTVGYYNEPRTFGISLIANW